MQLKISKYIDDHASDMIAALSSLVAVPSVRGAAEPGMPYGKERRGRFPLCWKWQRNMVFP